MATSGHIYWKYDEQLTRQNAILDRETHPKRTRELIKRYQGHALTNGVSQVRVAKLAWGLRGLSKTLKKPLDNATQADIEVALSTMLTTDIRPGKKPSLNTQRDRKRVVKQFYRWLATQEEYEHDKNLTRLVEYLRREVKTPDPKRIHDPGNILTEEDVQRVLDKGCASELERALIVTLFETGCRAGELLSIRICDITEETDLWAVRVNGKTGERTVPIVYAIPYLIRWLSVHPDRHNPNALLWLKNTARGWGTPLNYVMLRLIIKRCFTRAGVQKRNNPHWWRHTRCTLDAKDTSYTDSILCAKMGHGPKVAARYRHMSADDVKNAARRAAGIHVKEDAKKRPLLPQQCPECQEVNTHDARYCGKCGKPLTAKVIQEERDALSKALEALPRILADPVLRARYEEKLREITG